MRQLKKEMLFPELLGCHGMQAADSNVGATCKLAPEIMEGPYYVNETLLRTRIREDQPGVSLTLLIKVVDTACEPVADAFVDIWMCNATGFYSGYTSKWIRMN